MNIVTLNVRPCIAPLTWEEFCRTHPQRSVALDGYVYGGPKWNIAEKQVNFNHHEEVDRLATRSTCSQVLIAFRQGLSSFLRSDVDYRPQIFVNDCDEDVCLSVWMLSNPHMVTNSMNPRLNRMVHVEDMMDATGGAYPFHQDLPFLSEMAWVFEPYRIFRKSNGLQRRDAVEFKAVISDTGRRIETYLVGNAGMLTLDTEYTTLKRGKGWVMVCDSGAHARTAMFSEGATAFVEVRPRDAGGWDYTVGKMTPISDFPVSSILEGLNQQEGLVSASDRWGGGDMIGGSPRVAGSKLSPDQVFEAVEKIVGRK